MKQTPKHNHKSQQQLAQEQQGTICIPKTQSLKDDLDLVRRIFNFTEFSDEQVTTYLVHTVYHLIFSDKAKEALEYNKLSK